ncbi:MAG: hypothetical protein ACPGXK_14730 [Phycisphaerae bacterium]
MFQTIVIVSFFGVLAGSDAELKIESSEQSQFVTEATTSSADPGTEQTEPVSWSEATVDEGADFMTSFCCQPPGSACFEWKWPCADQSHQVACPCPGS